MDVVFSTMQGTAVQFNMVAESAKDKAAKTTPPPKQEPPPPKKTSGIDLMA